MLTEQASPATNGASGWSVKVSGPPETEAVWPPLEEQVMLNQVPDTVTASLNVTEIEVPGATSVAPAER